MPTFYITMQGTVLPTATLTLTRPIPRIFTTLDLAHWNRFQNPAGSTFAAWLHGDTPSASRLDVGNDFITPLTSFPVDIKDESTEILQFCRAIPNGLNNLSVEVKGGPGAINTTFQVGYQFST